MFFQRHCGLSADPKPVPLRSSNTGILRAEAAFWTQGESKMEHLLADNSARTQVEAGDGHFPGVRAQPGQGRLLSSGQLTTIFRNLSCRRLYSSQRGQDIFLLGG